MNSEMNDEFENRPRVGIDPQYAAEKLGQKSLGANNLASLAKSLNKAGASTNENNMLKIAQSSRKGTRTAVTKPKPRGGLAARKAEMEAAANGDTNGTAAEAPKPKRGKKNKASDGAAKPSKAASGRQTLFGFSACAVLRALGKAGLNKRHVAAIMEAKGLKLSDATVSVHVYQGAAKVKDKAVAELSDAQLEELKGAAKDPDAEKQLAKTE